MKVFKKAVQFPAEIVLSIKDNAILLGAFFESPVGRKCAKETISIEMNNIRVYRELLSQKVSYMRALCEISGGDYWADLLRYIYI